jgi:hypothetical protein
MMNVSGECVGRERCEELAKSSSFYRKVYSEVWLTIDPFPSSEIECSHIFNEPLLYWFLR